MRMPDLISVLYRQWKLIVLLTLMATVVALVACLISPRLYAGRTTALPANSALTDKARIFNRNIDALYSELGSPDELDKIEGTANLDTIYIATAKELNLMAHYQLTNEHKAPLDKAAKQLQKNTEIKRTGYGELQLTVWDKDKTMAATLANTLLRHLNEIHQHLQTENYRVILQQLQNEYTQKMQALTSSNPTPLQDSLQQDVQPGFQQSKALLVPQLQQYAQLINEYEIAVKTAPKALLVVEPARPQEKETKPDTEKAVLFAFFASLLFSVLLAFYVESRTT